MNKLFCDLKIDEEKAAFFLSGRGYETGVIAHSIQNDVAMAYHRCAEYRKELAALQAENERLKADSERLDWMDSNHFTAYRQCDPIDGLSVHCVVVPEAVAPRRGCVNDGIREAIDAAKAVQP